MNKYLPVFVAALCLIFNSIAEGEQWVYVGSTNLGDSYYDKDSITYTSADTLTIMLKWIPNEKTRAQRSADINIGSRYKNWKETRMLEAVNCSKRESSIISSTDFDLDGKVIYSTKFSLGPFPIRPEAQNYSLYNAVCGNGSK